MNNKLIKTVNRHVRGGVLLSFMAAWAVNAHGMHAHSGMMLNGGIATTNPYQNVGDQQNTINGQVVDAATGQGISGVSVFVKGTQRGTSTDESGNFSIQASSNETLVFTYLGHQPHEVIVGGQTIVNVSLQAEQEGLEEVVVVGYGTQTRREVTSAIASVKAEDFNAGGSRSPLDLIQGKVAGLNITRTAGNNPNSSVAIQLRGVTSLTGTTTPLIVIDGIPGGNLDLLQQDDIESFDVLKDGSAAAIYGTRGNAGVILITTKKGRAGEGRFEYNTYVQREVVDLKPDFLKASDFRDLIAQGVISESQDLGDSVDLYEELIDRQNTSQYHNLSASGGSANTNYRASLFFNEMNGIAKRNGREMFGGRINVNQTGLQDRLTLSVNLAANFNQADRLGGGGGADPLLDNGGADFEQAIQRNPTAPIMNPDGSFYETQNFNNYNPLGRLAHRLNERAQQTISGDARAEVKIIEGLTASAFGSYLLNNWNDREYRSGLDWDQVRGDYQGMGYAFKRNEKRAQQTFESTINYQTHFNDDHSLTALLGYSYQYETYERFDVNNNGFTTDGFLDWNLGAGSAIQNTQLPRPGMGSFKDDNTLIAFFGRVNYGFKNRYFLSGIVRREGSSRFGANNKWGNFPALSGAWTISEEDFMQDVDAIDFLKFRVGFGVTGNQGIPNYQSLVTLGTGGVYPQDGVYYQTYGAARNPNPNLRWEQKAEWNFGVDFGLFNNRVTGSFDVYNRETRDLLYNYNAQQPPFVRNTILMNVGSIRNKGVELQLSTVAMERGDFRWNIDVAANSQFNELTRLSNDVFKANWLQFGGLPSPGNLGYAIRLEEGGSVGNFYGKRFAGFDGDGRWTFYKADGSTGYASDMNDNDLTIIGNGVPKYQASLNNTFQYKNFDLTVFFRGKFAYDILNTKEMYFGNTRWLPNNMLRSAITTHAELNDDPQYSDYYIERGDFVKLDNLTLGYNFQLNSSYIRNMRIYVTGRNIWTITGYSGIDPELRDTGFTTGIDSRGFYPRTQSWAIGLNVGF